MDYDDNNFNEYKYSNNQNNNNATAKFPNNTNNNDLNEQYFREMESNAKLFELKMKRLSRYQQDTKSDNPKQSYPTQNEISNPVDYNSNKNQRNDQQPQLNQSNQKVIESLRNEIQYKDTLIAELRAEIESNKSPDADRYPRDNSQYERELDSMSNELNKKQNELSAYKEENVNLKLKIENLKLENTSIKQNKDRQINHTENLSIELAEKKEELSLLKRKFNECETINRNLKKDYELMIQKLTQTNKENTNNKAELDEMKANNYNLTQEINELRKKMNTKQQYPQQPKQCQVQQSIIEQKPIQQFEKITYQQQENMYSKAAFDNAYNSNNTNTNTNYDQNRPVRSNYGIQQQQQQQSQRIPDQSSFNINDHNTVSYEGFNYFPSEKRIKDNKNEMNSLDLQLNAWLKEKNLIENEMFRYAERPKTLNEIKAKKEKTERLKEIEERINEIKSRIRQLNN